MSVIPHLSDHVCDFEQQYLLEYRNSDSVAVLVLQVTHDGKDDDERHENAVAERAGLDQCRIAAWAVGVVEDSKPHQRQRQVAEAVNWWVRNKRD